MSKLDRSKPFGEIFGDSEGRRYVQDGQYFNALEEPIGGKAEKVSDASAEVVTGKAKGKAGKAKDVAPAETDAQLSAQLGA